MGKLFKLNKVLLGASALAVLTAGTAHAEGTAAGTNVQNTFTLEYTVGTTPQPVIDTSDDCVTSPTTDCSGTPTDFTVDRLIDLTVVSNGDTTVVPGAQDQELVFALTNEGNDEQDYTLDLVNESGDQFDTTGLTITYYFDDGVAGFGPGDIAGTAYTYTPGSGVNTETISPTGDTDPAATSPLVWVIVSSDIPTTAADPDVIDLAKADITLIADTANDGTTGAVAVPAVADTGGNTLTGAAENVLADIDSDAGGTNDGANDGSYAATGTYIVANPDLEAVKTVSVFAQDDTNCGTIPGTPVAGALAIPGACVEYVITVTNNGSNAGSNVTDIDFADILPSDLEFVAADVTTFAPADLSAPAANTDCDAGACTVALTDATLDFGQVGTVIIRALVK